MMCLLILLVFGYEYITIRDQLKNSLFYILVLLSIPFIFLSFKDNKLDREIGELSFSLYISHHLMVSVFRGYFFSNPHNMYLYGYTVVFSSLIIAFLLQKTIIKYIESYRSKLFS